MDNISQWLILLLLIESISTLAFVYSSKKERAELIKMIAARNYAEYKTLDSDGNQPTGKHKNMVNGQQNKILKHKQGGEV